MAVLLAAAAIAIVVVVLTTGGGSGVDQRQQAIQQIQREVVPEGVVSASAPHLGLSFRYAKGWVEEPSDGSVQFTSPDHSMSVAIATAGHGSAPSVLRNAARIVLGSYAPARVISHRKGSFAGRQVRTAEIVGQNDSGDPLRILALAARSPWKTYSVEVFSGTSPSLKRLAQAKIILDSVRFSKPEPRS